MLQLISPAFCALAFPANIVPVSPIIQNLNYKPIAVSYTHLDVYKRQLSQRGTNFFSQIITGDEMWISYINAKSKTIHAVASFQFKQTKKKFMQTQSHRNDNCILGPKGCAFGQFHGAWNNPHTTSLL